MSLISWTDPLFWSQISLKACGTVDDCLRELSSAGSDRSNQQNMALVSCLLRGANYDSGITENRLMINYSQSTGISISH